MNKEQNGEIWTYIASDLSNTYKIGQSTDIKGRIRDLSIGNPTIKLNFIIRGNVESALHKTFKEKRFIGEWYRLTKDDIKRIKLEYARFLFTPKEIEIDKSCELKYGTCNSFSIKYKIDKETIDFYFSYVMQHHSCNTFIFGVTKDIDHIVIQKGNTRGCKLLGYARGLWFNGISLSIQYWGTYSDYRKFERLSQRFYKKVQEER